MEKRLIDELKFCIEFWEKQGECTFGGSSKCNECATPYLVYKLITGNVLHGEKMKRLSLEDWKNFWSL